MNSKKEILSELCLIISVAKQLPPNVKFWLDNYRLTHTAESISRLRTADLVESYVSNILVLMAKAYQETPKAWDIYVANAKGSGLPLNYYSVLHKLSEINVDNVKQYDFSSIPEGLKETIDRYDPYHMYSEDNSVFRYHSDLEQMIKREVDELTGEVKRLINDFKMLKSFSSVDL